MKIRFYIGGLILMLASVTLSCRKALIGTNVTDTTATTTKPSSGPVTLAFSATAADTTAKLTVQIYDTNTGHVYYNSTTPANKYSGQTGIASGTSVTFFVMASGYTNINSQITSSNKVVATGNYSAQQDKGQVPAVTLYYKIP